MEKPAIIGGKPILEEPLPKSNNVDKHEINATMRVLKRGILSDFVGREGEKFLGGEEVLNFEREFGKKFNMQHAVSFSSATTALDAAVCALGIKKGDEVIVSPYTMSASATCILMNGATPVFVDIERETFNLDPKEIEKNITKRTKAILVTNIFGGSAKYNEILNIARKYHLKLIEDNAQSIGAMFEGKYTGTIGDIGVFSFNCHKTIQCGEGGVLVTNNKDYAFRAQLKRNHGEVVLDDMNSEETILGSNYRLTEVGAAIANEQLKKLDFLNEKRIELADYLTKKLEGLPGISVPKRLKNSKHVYYAYPILFDEKEFGLNRHIFCKAMNLEGFDLGEGYVKPLYYLKIFNSSAKCPVTEELWDKKMILTHICRYPLTYKHMDKFVEAIKKVEKYKGEISRFIGFK